MQRTPRRRAPGALPLALVALAGCHRPAPPARGGGPAVPLFDDLGAHHHAITTGSAEAQRYFDQGLRLVYAFNHDEAERAFREAARLDPRAPMPWWGVALALGPNINMPLAGARARAAWDAIERARRLRANGSPRERRYVDALARRYAAEPGADRSALDAAYTDAMRSLARDLPDDLDAATLFAEAQMDQRPWDLWTPDGEPQPGTDELVATLERVLARDPRHPGANHYYIHAVEASPHPERALAAAQRLAGLVPGAGHLVHMPSHIYMRLGRYADASDANERAIAADERYAARAHPSDTYALMYGAHNYQFLAASAAMEGRSAVALRAAQQLASIPPELVRTMPSAAAAWPLYELVLLRFGRWDELLARPEPPEDLRFPNGVWHFARGMALVARGRPQDAAEEHERLRRLVATVPPSDAAGQNATRALLQVASDALEGELAMARGDTHAGIAYYETAVRGEDALRYDEPPNWLPPVRHFYGAALLAHGLAADAERVYRDDLARNPENGWALAGLLATLRARHADAEAAKTEERLRRAWARADVESTGSRR